MGKPKTGILFMEGAKGFAPADTSIMVEGAKLHDEVTFGDTKESSLDKDEKETLKMYRDFMEAKMQERKKKAEGSLMVPPEMEEVPTDTYTPEDQANAEETQLPDDEMEGEYIDFVFSEALQPEEQDYLTNALEADPQLSQIFDKVVETASEFSGSGEVEGPGTGVSDSIPARLSDGEFVMTRKATDQIGADNLQVMMDDAERAYDGGLQRKNEGGLLSKPENSAFSKDSADDEVEKLMMASNRMPSVR